MKQEMTGRSDLLLPRCPFCGKATEPWIIFFMDDEERSQWGFRCVACDWKITSQIPYEEFAELCRSYEDNA